MRSCKGPKLVFDGLCMTVAVPVADMLDDETEMVDDEPVASEGLDDKSVEELREAKPNSVRADFLRRG